MMQEKLNGFSFPEVLISILLVSSSLLVLMKHQLLINQQINYQVRYALEVIIKNNHTERDL